LAVHYAARVGPRNIGTENDVNMYYAADAQDRIRNMHRVEQFRARYRVTKVTTKMLFALNFHSRPIDHFLSTPEGDQYVHQRVVTHDGTQWGGTEPAPAHTISTAAQLQRVLYTIQDGATIWYPEAVVRVFRAVLNHANHDIHASANVAVVNAMMNLYTSVFSSMFSSILAGADLWGLEGRAQRTMQSDSQEYGQYVRQPLNEVVMGAVFRPVGQPLVQAYGRQRANDQRRPPAAGPGGPRPPKIPQQLRSQIPVVNGKQVCLRFQVARDCDFPRCHHTHTLVNLPADVLAYITATHGALKREHPQHS
jgi:hypothetical protein